ncbi:MAG: hemolysin family protein [Alphaproteobacteria bacterium]
MPLEFIKSLLKPKTDTSLRDAIEEYIEEPDALEMDAEALHERALFSNILALRDIAVDQVMIPRADILAIDVNASRDDIFAMLADKQVSRIPVYKDNLDDVLGTIHLKDIIACMANNKEFSIKDNITEIPIVSPSMPILDLLLTMRQSRRHMALVVDEYGGIDGLVTIGDIVESVLGEIDDEHDPEQETQILEQDDGALLVDARYEIEDFEGRYGHVLKDEEREENDTLGGLVFTLAGRVPARGERLKHSSGMVFEIMDADPRRVHLIRVRNVPVAKVEAAE